MKRRLFRVVVLSLMICFVVPVVSIAQTVDERVEALERRVAQLEMLLEKAGVVVPEEMPEEETQTNIGDRISLSGALEVEAAYVGEKQFVGSKNRSSDIVLATLELGIEANINDRTTGKTTGNLVLLWEEDATEPIDIDEGTITWMGNEFDVTAGRFYMPFGTFNSHFISDPLTLEIGEIQQSGIQLHFVPSNFFEASLAFANGEVDKTTQSDNITDYGLRLDFHPVMGESSLDIGLQYYSDIADTDGEISGGTGNILNKVVGGLGINIDWTNGPWSANAEYVGAVRSFDPADLDADADNSGDKPSTWNLEVAYSISELHELALKYEGSSEFTDFPKSQYGIASIWDMDSNTTLAAEYLYGTFDQDFSTAGNRRRHSLTTQLAIEF
ncbi:LbtU family siderophore porin [bacterium]